MAWRPRCWPISGADLGRVRVAVNTLMTGGPEVDEGQPSGQPVREASPAPQPLEPSCPRCRADLAESARYRALVVTADTEDAAPLSVYVVYCRACGTTLPVLQTDSPS